MACEYCDARIQIAHAPHPAEVAPSHSNAAGHTTHVATPQYSDRWVAGALVAMLLIFYAVVLLYGHPDLRETLFGERPPPADPAPTRPAPTRSTPAVEPETPSADASVTATEMPKDPDPPDSPAHASVEPPETEVDEGDAAEAGGLWARLWSLRPETEVDEGDTVEPTKAPKKSTSGARPSMPPAQPAGPVLSVAEATRALEPAILECMKAAGVHRVSLHMGNEKVGGVSILNVTWAPKPRVDGLLVSLPRTKLGRCINEAGRTVRTRAFKSNYLTIDVRNPGVPDPLAAFPETLSKQDFEAALGPLDDQVRACATKHGEEGQRIRISVRVDGPAGKLTFARPMYTSKAFASCVERLYKTVVFPRAKRYNIDYHHTVET